jgi:hypothetical protein
MPIIAGLLARIAVKAGFPHDAKNEPEPDNS